MSTPVSGNGYSFRNRLTGRLRQVYLRAVLDPYSLSIDLNLGQQLVSGRDRYVAVSFSQTVGRLSVEARDRLEVFRGRVPLY